MGHSAHLHHHHIRCWDHRLFQSKYTPAISMPSKSTQHTIATTSITPRAVAGGTTGSIAVPAIVPTVSTSVVPGSVVVTSSVATIALVAGGGLRIVPAPALEATIGTLGAVKRLVNTDHPSVESETCMRWLRSILDARFWPNLTPGCSWLPLRHLLRHLKQSEQSQTHGYATWHDLSPQSAKVDFSASRNIFGG